jgi:baculoviral IAP repeat-containing protein 2/3
MLVKRLNNENVKIAKNNFLNHKFFVGFYYLQTADQVQCIVCKGVIGQWEPNDSPLEEHRKFFPNCQFLQSQNDLFSNEEIGIQQVRSLKYPEFATVESRIRSFSTWNSSTQDGNILAYAGFYYLGNADEVRCFSCDGGLRNWLSSDDPWFEHARWFPKCPFIVLAKGQQYIKDVLRQTQDTLPATTTPSAPNDNVMSIEDAMCLESAREALNMGLNAGRIRSVLQRRLNLRGRPFPSTEALVAAVLDEQIEDEGYDQEEHETENQIENQVTELLLSAVSSVAFNSNEDADQNHHHHHNPLHRNPQQQQQQQQPSTSTSASNALSSNVPDLISASKKTKEHSNATSTRLMSKVGNDVMSEKNDERRLKNVECKICFDNEVGVVFLPCGHLLSCVYCAPAISHCPLCRQSIKGRVRTFLS